MKIKPAQATLNELRDGQVMNELAQALHDALGAVKEHRKGAEVSLTISIKPLGNKGVSDAYEVIAEVTSKLPKAPPPSTLFFEDSDSNLSRRQERQSEIPGLSVAGSNPDVKQPSAAA